MLEIKTKIYKEGDNCNNVAFLKEVRKLSD